MELGGQTLPYFHPGITKEDAEQLLQPAREGSFLLRPRQSARDGLCIVCATSSGIKHYSIVRTLQGGGGGPQWSLENARPQLFASLRQVVAYYTLHPLSRKDQTCLAHPVTCDARSGAAQGDRDHDDHAVHGGGGGGGGGGEGAADASAHMYEEPGGPGDSHEYADVLPGAFYSATAPNTAPTTATECSFLQRCAKSSSELRAAMAGLAGGGPSEPGRVAPRRRRSQASQADRLKQELAHFFTNPVSAREVQGLDLSSLLASPGHGQHASRPAPSRRTSPPKYTDLGDAATYGSTRGAWKYHGVRSGDDDDCLYEVPGDGPTYTELSGGMAVNKAVLDKVRRISEAQRNAILSCQKVQQRNAIRARVASSVPSEFDSPNILG